MFNGSTKLCNFVLIFSVPFTGSIKLQSFELIILCVLILVLLEFCVDRYFVPLFYQSFLFPCKHDH